MSNNGRLTITDGTAANTVSMLVGLPGTMLQDWYPKSPQPLSSIWASSPYQDGKQLVNKTYNNIADLFTTSISAETQDADIHNLRRFIVLLEKAVLYWTDEFSTQKYWLEVRGECETNIRYALVVDYNIPEITDPFVQPFASNTESVLESIQIIIEHTIWTDELGVGDSCVEISTGVSTGTIESPGPEEEWDDCYINNAPMIVGDGVLAVGAFAAGLVYDAGIRFIDVHVPPNAIITSAWITFTGADADVDNNCNLLIKIEDDVAPAIFSTMADFLGRVMYGTSVAWDKIPSVTGGVSYNSPSLVPLIQYIVNKGGWASGNNIAIFLWNNASTVNAHRQFESWDTGPEPILNIEWASATLHGEPASCLRGAAVQPLWRDRLLTHAFTEDISLGTFGPNLVETANGYPLLLPVVVNDGDSLYAGIYDLGDPDLASTFNSLVIHLGVVGSGQTLVPEYWDGAAWVSFTHFREWPDSWGSATATLGIHLMVWEYPNDWDQCIVNGVSGYWMRFRIDAHVANVPPRRAAPFEPIYTISWPHIQVSGSELQGDIGALINFLISNQSDAIDRIMISARKYSRTNGGKFVAYIPFNTHVVLPDATYTPAAAVVETVWSGGYTGWVGYYISAGAATVLALTVDLGPRTYAGRYRAFIRVQGVKVAPVGDIGYQLRVSTDYSVYYTPVIYNQAATNFMEVIDLGLIAFPPEPLEESVTTSYLQSISLYITDGGGTDEIVLYDLILMPVDDAHIEIELADAWVDIYHHIYFPWKIVTTNYKLGAYGFVLDNQATPTVLNWDGNIIKGLKTNILGAFELEPEEDYWIIFLAYPSTPSPLINYPQPFEHLLAPSLDKNQRYLLARGDE